MGTTRRSLLRRRWARRTAIAAGVVIVLAAAGPFVYIHLIQGSPPAKLTLPAGSSDASSAGDGSDGGDVSGSWAVTSQSIVGYRVSETLVGQKNTAVGRTSSVTGSIDIDHTTVRSAQFTVQMDTVKSDESQRDAQFDGRIMDVGTYPTATFALSRPLSLGTLPPVGAVHSYQVTGKLTLRGQTHPVTFTINAERTITGIELQGDIKIAFATWGIANPSVGFVTTADDGTIEFLLVLARGTTTTPTTTPTSPTVSGNGSPGGSPPEGGGFSGDGGFGGGGGGGGGGPDITVPATTVPPLTIPKS